MRILFLTPRFPLPAVKGDKIRAWHLLRALSDVHDVTLLSYIADPDERDMVPKVQDVCSVEVVPFVKTVRAAGLVKGLWRPHPLQTVFYESAAFKRLVAQHLPQCDAVHCNTLRVATNIPSQARIPFAVDFVDALSATYTRRAAAEAFPKSLAFRIEGARLNAFEQELRQKAAFTCAVSAEEARLLGPDVQDVRHGVDTDMFHPPDKDRPRDGIIFAGNLSYPPNVEAAVMLADQILPRIRRTLPHVRVRLVGATPARRVRALAADTVDVAGYVPDIAAELQRSAVAVIPIRSGGGLKTKVLEAMATATPVVAATAANTGINAKNGAEIILADDPETLAAETVALLNDQQRAAAIGAAGRRLVERDFGWRAAGKKLLECYERVQQTAKERSEPPIRKDKER